MNDIIKYMAGSAEVELSPDIVRQQITVDKTVTDQEIAMFIHMCRYHELNPFTREIFLVKYGGENPRTATIIAKDGWLKRAATQVDYRGFKAGIVVASKDGKLTYREGSMVLPTETLVGGWSEIFKQGWETPIRSEVSFTEYNTGRSLWRSIPATMIRKVALTQALREAFPVAFAGVYGEEEMDQADRRALSKPRGVVEVKSEEVMEGLTIEHQDAIWEMLGGSEALRDELLKQTGKDQLELINDKAFAKLMKMAKELAAKAGLKPSEPRNPAIDYRYQTQAANDGDEQITEDMLKHLRNLLDATTNRNDLIDLINEEANIWTLEELSKNGYKMAIDTISASGIFKEGD